MDIRMMATVIFSPSEAFDALKRRPAWGICAAVVLVIMVVSAALVAEKLDGSFFVDQQMAESGQVTAGASERAQIEAAPRMMMALWATATGMNEAMGFSFIVVGLWTGFALIGKEVSFRSVSSITAHAYVPYAVSAAATAIVALGRETVLFHEYAVGTVLKASPAAFLSPQAGVYPTAVLASLDVFTLWFGALLYLGLSKFSSARSSQVAAIVGVVWLSVVGARIAVRVFFLQTAS